MASSPGPSSMVMFEDQSVDVRYGNGAHLQLSPCGSEFTLVGARDPTGHPLQTTQRVRQRSRFTVSAYRDLLIAALAFRNKYASRPYLPEELIPADHKQPFVSIHSEIRWPKRSSSAAECGPEGEFVVRSDKGRAVFTLSPSGEEFYVKYNCRLSQPQQQCSAGLMDRPQMSKEETAEDHKSREKRRHEPVGSRSRSPQIITDQPKPEDMYLSTTVIQHHSYLDPAPAWSYPLSLARSQWTARLCENAKGLGATGTRREDMSTNTSDRTTEDRRSLLCQALPLTCSAPHRHRWKVKDPLAKKQQPEHECPTELVKVMWCQGVTYRILSGAVPVIEVSPGDGSVIRSNGVLNTYFIHHKPELQSMGVKEVTYHLNCLPPDAPGQVYSIGSIVSRASRILSCYNEAKQSLKLPATPSCLQEDSIFSKPAVHEENIPVMRHVDETQELRSWSDLVDTELEKIKRFNFLLDNSYLLRNEEPCAESSTEAAMDEAVSESCVVEALQRTSKAIQDIDALISAAALT